MSWSPWFSKNEPDMQYVETLDFRGEDRYVFGSLDQETFGFTVRLDYTVTPDFTVQYYGSPFLSSGRYSDFRRITDPRAEAYEDRSVRFSSDEIRFEDDGYAVDEDG